MRYLPWIIDALDQIGKLLHKIKEHILNTANKRCRAIHRIIDDALTPMHYEPSIRWIIKRLIWCYGKNLRWTLGCRSSSSFVHKLICIMMLVVSENSSGEWAINSHWYWLRCECQRQYYYCSSIWFRRKWIRSDLLKIKFLSHPSVNVQQNSSSMSRCVCMLGIPMRSISSQSSHWTVQPSSAHGN